MESPQVHCIVKGGTWKVHEFTELLRGYMKVHKFTVLLKGVHGKSMSLLNC